MTGIRRIFLVGMMGSGKTTIGRRLARETGWPYVDNDALVLEATGQTTVALAALGESALHDAETLAFERVLNLEPPVIAGIAGFVITDPAARARLRAAGHVVWLRADPATLRQRAGTGVGRRAEATSLEWIARTATERAGAFGAVADLVIDVDRERPAEVVARILAVVTGSRPAGKPPVSLDKRE